MLLRRGDGRVTCAGSVTASACPTHRLCRSLSAALVCATRVSTDTNVGCAASNCGLLPAGCTLASCRPTIRPTQPYLPASPHLDARQPTAPPWRLTVVARPLAVGCLVAARSLVSGYCDCLRRAGGPMATVSDVRIEPLSAHPEHVDGTAALLYAEWANLYALDKIHSEQQLADKLRALNPPTATTLGGHWPLPTTLIALAHDSTLIGTAAIDNSDLPRTHPYFPVTPWLSSVLVSESWRGKGVAGRLVRGVEAEARRRGLEWLWLWTTHSAKVDMYVHLGWQVVERVWLAETAKHITVMRNDFVRHDQHTQPLLYPPHT